MNSFMQLGHRVHRFATGSVNREGPPPQTQVDQDDATCHLHGVGRSSDTRTDALDDGVAGEGDSQRARLRAGEHRCQAQRIFRFLLTEHAAGKAMEGCLADQHDRQQHERGSGELHARHRQCSKQQSGQQREFGGQARIRIARTPVAHQAECDDTPRPAINSAASPSSEAIAPIIADHTRTHARRSARRAFALAAFAFHACQLATADRDEQSWKQVANRSPSAMSLGKGVPSPVPSERQSMDDLG